MGWLRAESEESLAAGGREPSSEGSLKSANQRPLWSLITQ